MNGFKSWLWGASSIAILLSTACAEPVSSNEASQIDDSQTGSQPAEAASISGPEVNPENWPLGQSGVDRDPEIEAFIADLVSRMSVEEKVGQVIQADISAITPELAAQYNLGSVLNGGNSGPYGNNFAPPEDWVALADEYYYTSTDTSDGGVGIPIIWGTDAVHGHSNIVGATLFPHNIALGAVNDPDLMHRIGEITALEIRATGQDWTFAPTLAVVQNDTWGRTYESYSENPDIVARMSGPLVEGLQGTPGTDEFLGPDHIVSTAKHFLGDGGTFRGIDQGDNRASEEDMRDIHGAGYPPAIAAGVQTVMASFNSWHGVKFHGLEVMLSDVLVDRMGFDGFVIGDWEGHGQVEGCTNQSCPQALIAGLDMYMASGSWQDLHGNLLTQVQDGTVSMERLNEAVTRILRVKARAGLFDGVAPSEREHAGNIELIGHPDHRAVAREAVRRSLVLLKNENAVLPLASSANILLAGNGADNIRKQSGGWTINWQGDDLTNDDFPGGQSVYDGFVEAVAEAGGSVTLSEDGSYDERPDVAVIVFGEDPYAEFMGDKEYINFEDESGLELLRQFQAEGIPTVAVFLSGRPMWMNRELNASDAFVAAWLPGSEGGGIADVLVGGDDGTPRYDFEGTLPFSWPATATQTVLNPWDDGYDPLFGLGYGLTYEDNQPIGELSEDSGIEELHAGATNLIVNGRAITGTLAISDEAETVEVTSQDVTLASGVSVELADANVQDDSRRIIWQAPADFYLEDDVSEIEDLENMSLEIHYQVSSVREASVSVFVDCETESCRSEIDVTTSMSLGEGKGWRSGRLAYSCFADVGADLSDLSIPFGIRSEAGADLWITDTIIVNAQPGDEACEL